MMLILVSDPVLAGEGAGSIERGGARQAAPARVMINRLPATGKLKSPGGVGLSTAPEIRAALDRLAAVVQDENLMGALEALGLTPAQKVKLLKLEGKDVDGTGSWVALEQGDGTWEDPFKK